MNLNTKGKAEHTYDAIVVGSGISGGWAAKELCEKGLKTLVLERGHKLEHIADYKTTNSPPVAASMAQQAVSRNDRPAGKATPYHLHDQTFAQ